MNKLLGWGGLAIALSALALGFVWDAASNIPHGFYAERTIE